MEEFSLNTFLIWIISGGATVVVRLIAARIPVLQRELSEGERSAVTMFCSVVLIGAAFVGATQAGYIPTPQSGLGWFEALFVPIMTALGVPALMTTAMVAKRGRALRREAPGMGAMSVERNKLFGIRW